jgi:hypothetical protein
MKRLFTTLIAFAFSLGLSAQITITRDDMPNIGDTIRVSNAAILFGFDPSLTGSDFDWDFTNLEPQSQAVEGYVSTTSTPFLYQIIFNQNVASIASPITDVSFLPGFEITDAFIFYRETASSYVRAGYGATVSGIPIPIKFDFPELLYSFPVTATSPADSSLSNYSLGLPGVGYFSIERKRVNTVDGWGSLTTPYGTFDVLRVKSDIYERDSLYLDSLQAGIPIIRNYSEYQWLTNGRGIPVLAITQEGPLTTARYIDTIQNLTPMVVNPGPDQNICRGTSTTITAEVSGGTPPYSFLWSTLDTTAAIVVSPLETTTYTVIVTDLMNNMSFGSVTVNVTDFKDINLGADTLLCANFTITFNAGEGLEEIQWFVNGVEQSQSPSFTIDSTGIGLNEAVVRLDYKDNGCAGSDEIVVNFYICGGLAEYQTVSIKIAPNPVDNFLAIEHNQFTERAEIFIASSSGQISKPKINYQNQERILINTDALKPGNYLIVITEGNLKGTAKFIKN